MADYIIPLKHPATLESVWKQAQDNHRNYSATGNDEEDLRFFTLGVAGEAGEAIDAIMAVVRIAMATGGLSNLVKKRWRDGTPLTDEVRR